MAALRVILALVFLIVMAFPALLVAAVETVHAPVNDTLQARPLKTRLLVSGLANSMSAKETALFLTALDVISASLSNVLSPLSKVEPSSEQVLIWSVLEES